MKNCSLLKGCLVFLSGVTTGLLIASNKELKKKVEGMKTETKESKQAPYKVVKDPIDDTEVNNDVVDDLDDEECGLDELEKQEIINEICEKEASEAELDEAIDFIDKERDLF